MTRRSTIILAVLAAVALWAAGCETPRPTALCLDGQIVELRDGGRVPTGRRCAEVAP